MRILSHPLPAASAGKSKIERIEPFLLRIIGGADLPAPALELLAVLQRGERTRAEVRALGVPLARALEALERHPAGAGLVIQGETLRWVGESDLRRFWAAADAGDLPEAWGLYGALLPGWAGASSEFATWLEGEQAAMLSALLDLALPNPTVAHSLSEQALSAPRDPAKTLAALLLQAEVHLRREQGKKAVFILGKALGLQEFQGRAFSALSLALLAEAHALWGKGRKAEETVRKALDRAADPYARSRAHFALFRARGDADDLSAATNEAEQTGAKRWREYLASQRTT